MDEAAVGNAAQIERVNGKLHVVADHAFDLFERLAERLSLIHI